MIELEFKNKKGLIRDFPLVRVQNKSLIAKALWQCLVEDDVEAFKEILRTHLEFTNKDTLAKKTGIPRRTLFRMLSPEGNPTLENVSKIIHELCG